MIDAIVYFVLNLIYGYKLIINYSIKSRKFLACVFNILWNKIVGYEDVFANILFNQCLPILDYCIDTVLIWTLTHLMLLIKLGIFPLNSYSTMANLVIFVSYFMSIIQCQ